MIHETVGVGQTERDVVSAADTTVVVLVPESGDSIQAMKAGLMEIADVFVVNKADRPGADKLARALRATLGLRAAPDDGWEPPIVRTVAVEGQGIDELDAAIESHTRARPDDRRSRQEARRARSRAGARHRAPAAASDACGSSAAERGSSPRASSGSPPARRRPMRWPTRSRARPTSRNRVTPKE